MKMLWSAGPLYEDDPNFKITTDSVLLASFAARRDVEYCLDMGCGGGLLSVLLHYTCPDAAFTAIDLREDAAAQCRKNFAANNMHGGVLCADIRNYREIGGGGRYDLVVCNPPYYYNNVPRSPDPARAAARAGTLSPAQFSGAAAYFLRRGGEFCLVHKPEFLTDIFSAMRLANIEPKRMRLVAHKADSAPSLVLISGRQGGRPGLTLLPQLTLCEPDGRPSPEVREIYHMK